MSDFNYNGQLPNFDFNGISNAGGNGIYIDASQFTSQNIQDGQSKSNVFSLLNYGKWELLPQFELYNPTKVYPQTLPDGSFDIMAYYKNNAYKNESELEFYTRKYKETAQFFDYILTEGNDTYIRLQNQIGKFSEKNPFEKFEFYTAAGGKLVSKSASVAAAAFVGSSATAATLTTIAGVASTVAIYVAAFYAVTKIMTAALGLNDAENQQKRLIIKGSQVIISNAETAVKKLQPVLKQYEDKITQLKKVVPSTLNRNAPTDNQNNWLSVIFFVVIGIMLYKLEKKTRR